MLNGAADRARELGAKRELSTKESALLVWSFARIGYCSDSVEELCKSIAVQVVDKVRGPY